MTKFFNKIKKPSFWPFFVNFPNFEVKKKNSGKSGPAKHNLTWVSSTLPKFTKTNDTTTRKHLDGRLKGQMDRQIPFQRTLPTTVRGSQN